jgi:hypothetical protein
VLGCWDLELCAFAALYVRIIHLVEDFFASIFLPFPLAGALNSRPFALQSVRITHFVEDFFASIFLP